MEGFDFLPCWHCVWGLDIHSWWQTSCHQRNSSRLALVVYADDTCGTSGWGLLGSERFGVCEARLMLIFATAQPKEFAWWSFGLKPTFERAPQVESLIQSVGCRAVRMASCKDALQIFCLQYAAMSFPCDDAKVSAVLWLAALSKEGQRAMSLVDVPDLRVWPTKVRRLRIQDFTSRIQTSKKAEILDRQRPKIPHLRPTLGTPDFWTCRHEFVSGPEVTCLIICRSCGFSSWWLRSNTKHPAILRCCANPKWNDCCRKSPRYWRACVVIFKWAGFGQDLLFWHGAPWAETRGWMSQVCVFTQGKATLQIIHIRDISLSQLVGIGCLICGSCGCQWVLLREGPKV